MVSSSGCRGSCCSISVLLRLPPGMVCGCRSLLRAFAVVGRCVSNFHGTLVVLSICKAALFVTVISIVWGNSPILSGLPGPVKETSDWTVLWSDYMLTS